MSYDVVIIGAGVSGALIARELSRYNVKVAVLEKFNDAAMATSKANSAIVHAGFDAAEGTLKAMLNVKGSEKMPVVCKELGVPYKNIGSLVVAFNDEDVDTLEKLLERGKNNGVSELEIIDKKKLKELEPNISDEAVCALWAGTAAIVCPYELTIAAIENAVVNGVEFIRNCAVTSIESNENKFTLQTSVGEIEAKYIINASGVHADEISAMIGDTSFDITPRIGEYFLLDKSIGQVVNHTIFQCPGKLGKGVLISPTVDNNIIVGPSAMDVEDKNDVSTTAEGLNFVNERAHYSVPSLNTRAVIRTFSGLRAHCTKDDFIIEASTVNSHFINVAGIESPGLSAAPAIAEYAVEILKSVADKELEKKSEFKPERAAPVRFREMSTEEQKALIEKNKAYGRIICRCETVTEGEIIDAIRAPAGARDIDGVKRRTRAGMGRCQGGFCGSKVLEILSKEMDVEPNEITKFGGNSKILFEKTK